MGKLIYVIAILISVTVALTIRSYVIEPFRISSPVMRPALEVGDIIFVKKMGSSLSLDREPVKPGDIVLFRPEKPPVRDFIKRVVAIQGDSVEVLKGRLSVNGKVITSDLTNNEACAPEVLNDRTYQACLEVPLIENYPKAVVPAGKIFVIGDLRSRNVPDLRKDLTWGLIPIDQIRGKVTYIWLSLEPANPGGGSGWFPRIRFDRMFKKVL